MGVIIRKKDNGEIFDIPYDFALEINNTSPIFNELGSKSVTTTIPKTLKNAHMLGYMHRLDITNKPKNKIAVVVYDGAYTRDGMLYPSSASNTSKGYGITIAFNEGIMYEEMSNIKLTSLSNLPVIEKSSEDMIAYMNTLYTVDDMGSELTAFWAYLFEETYNSNIGDQYLYTHLNHPNDTFTGLKMFESIELIIDSQKMDVPVPPGYGITPFIRVWRVLELIFDHFGYKISDNPFKTDYQLRRLCVLNNTTDTIVLNKIDYSQLLPDTTAVDFLKSLYCRFGLKVFVDGGTKTVRLRLLKDIFASTNLSPLSISSLPDIEYTEPKQLKLSAATNLDKAKPETDNFSDFLKKYNNTVGSYRETQVPLVSGVVFSLLSGFFYQVSTVYENVKLLSSMHFEWDQQSDGIEYEELTSVDECITMDTVGSRIPYLGLKGNLLNSRLEVEDETQDVGSNNKLMFAFDMGNTYRWEGNNKIYNVQKWGSIFPYAYSSKSGSLNEYHKDRDGNEFHYSLIFIGENGCFNRFHAAYDAFLRHSNHTVKVEIHKPLFELSNLPYNNKYSVDHQPLFLDKFNYVLGRRKLASLEARTIRLYQPYDLSKDHYMPVPDPIKYQWSLFNNKGDGNTGDIKAGVDAKRTSIIEENEHTPGYQFDSLVFLSVLEDNNPPTNKDFWYLPPTDREYNDNVTIGTTSHQCKIRCTYRYYLWNVAYTGPIDFFIAYRAWFIPVSVV